jgi:hypothetical protein
MEDLISQRPFGPRLLEISRSAALLFSMAGFSGLLAYVVTLPLLLRYNGGK